MKNNHKIWRFIYKSHRYIGLCSAIVLLVLAVTGIALNHTELLKLDSTMVQSRAVLDWYGIKSSSHLNSFATKNHWLTQSDQQIYLDHSPIVKTDNRLIGVIETNDFIVLAFNNSLFLLSSEGDVIEQMPIINVEKIGLNPQYQVVIESNGLFKASDDELITWQPYKKQDVLWSNSSSPPADIEKTINKLSRSTILPLERVFLDLHSGRFFGTIGVVIVDLTGLFLIILVLSGCTIWVKHKLRSLRN